MIRFRPLLLPTLITLPALAVLIGLGQWQLDRLAWKTDLIERAASRSDAPPVDLPPPSAWPSLPLEEWEYRPVRMSGAFDHANEIHVFTSLPDPRGRYGGPGYWIMTPLLLDAGGTVFVNRGFVPAPNKDPESRGDGQVGGPQAISGLLRLSEAGTMLTPDPDPDRLVWYRRDADAFARELGLIDAAPFLVDARETPPGGLPQAGETRLTFRNEHLSYALTWFGLAVVLVVIYGAFHAKRGRLRLGRHGRQDESA